MPPGNADERPGQTTDPAREFLDFWKNYFEQTAIQSRILLESMQGGKSLDQLHNQWLGTLSDSLDGFMRTPPFLDVLKQSIERMVAVKRQQDQMTQAVAQQVGLPLAADVTGVFERVASAERAIMARLERLEGRLEAIEHSLQSTRTEKKSPARRGQSTPKARDDDLQETGS
jgi:hypothetical protein